MSIIEARGIVACYGASAVLSGIDFDARTGEVVGLIGPNGAGKSTLLRVLAHLLKPQSGEVRYDGRTADRYRPREFARFVAYLAQSGPVHWPMRVDRLVALGRLPHRDRSAAESQTDRDATDRALKTTGTSRFRARTMAELSVGERMRVLLARALAVEADILLADEPIAGLDPRHQLAMMAALRDTAALGRGVVVVLHDLSLAARFCDRLVLLVDGRVLAQGGAGEVLTSRNLSRAYGVEMIHGERDGARYLIPWTALPAP